MPWWAIVACAVFGVLGAVGTVVIVLSVIRLGRRSRSLQKALEPRIRALELSTAELERRGYSVELGQAHLTASVASLNGSVAQLSVLNRALDDVRMYTRFLRLFGGL
jgi:hypothetical protein